MSEPVAPRWWVAIAVGAMLMGAAGTPAADAAPARAAATGTAPSPLRLHLKPSGPPTATPLSVLRRRFVARVTPDNRLIIRDDRARRRYELSIQPREALLGGCRVADVLLPDALLQCNGSSPFPNAFVIASLPSGALQILRPHTGFVDGPPGQAPFGVRPGDSYAWLGRAWVRGIASDPSLTRYDAVWLHRRTSRSDPKGDLLLMRCGRRPLVISRCPRGCSQPAFNDRFVTWLTIEEGATDPTEVVVRSIRTRRVYRRRLAGEPSALAATTSRILVTRAFTEVESFDIVGTRTRTTYRTSEIPLPASVR